MHPTPIRILFLLLLFSSLVAAANFTQCLDDFKNDPGAVGGVDSRGHPTSSAEAVGLTYETCKARCGKSAEIFSWREFAQLFSAWLLPWLALISQLPYGSSSYRDDFISIILSVGSPALVAYSLALTSLNAQSVYRRVQRIHHLGRTGVTRALISLQQTPLELTKDERLLAYIWTNDTWKREIVDHINRRNSWSIATGTSIIWVVVAFLFTLVDSFVSLSNSDDTGSQGHAVGTLWLWLLCLVAGVLWAPTFTRGELWAATHRANRKTIKTVKKSIQRRTGDAYRKVAKLQERVGFLNGPEEPVPSPILEVTEEDGKVGANSVKGDTGLLQVPDLTHDRSTAETPYGRGWPSDNANPIANHSIVSLPHSAAAHSVAAHSMTQSSIHPDTHELLIHKSADSLNREEFRFAATFNYSRVIRYLAFVDDVLGALDKFAREEDEKTPGSGVATRPAKTVVFPPGVFVLMFKALIPALILQCGTTAAAIIIIVFTPTIGLGCRSLGYTIYGGTAILVLFLAITSTIFVRISETRTNSSTIIKGFTKFIAITLRKVSHSLAFINAIGLILISCFQFSHFLDNCYCNASVIGRGTDSYIVVSLEGWISTMRISRIAATVLSAVSMAVYMIFLWVMNSLPTEIIDDL